MLSALPAAVILANFAAYPQFVQPNSVVEAWVDKGLIVEMIISCPSAPPSAIMTFSKTERLYCLPDDSCYGDGRVAIKRLCR